MSVWLFTAKMEKRLQTKDILCWRIQCKPPLLQPFIITTRLQQKHDSHIKYPMVFVQIIVFKSIFPENKSLSSFVLLASQIPKKFGGRLSQKHRQSMWPPCFQLLPDSDWHAIVTELALHWVQYKFGVTADSAESVSTVTTVVLGNIWETFFKWFLFSDLNQCVHGLLGSCELTRPTPLCAASPPSLTLYSWSAGQQLMWCLSQHPNMWQYVHHYPLIYEARGTGLTSYTEHGLLLHTISEEW